ncbi:head-tail connector protein [Clostridium perfringens]|jgi:uncharacterized phage protein (predicted DNA packaging)|nr:head-tail connector protein [Clostridium perfringens]
MKPYEINLEYLKQYLRIDDNESDDLLLLILSSAKAYVKSVTGQDENYLDFKEDISIAILSLCCDLYENREYSVKNENVNRIVNTILNMHKINNVG